MNPKTVMADRRFLWLLLAAALVLLAALLPAQARYASRPAIYDPDAAVKMILQECPVVLRVDIGE